MEENEEIEELSLPTFHQLLEGLIFFDNSSDMLPLAQYVRSRLRASEAIPPHLPPHLSALLKVRPGTVQSALLSMLNNYMDEHPEKFFRLISDHYVVGEEE